VELTPLWKQTTEVQLLRNTVTALQLELAKLTADCAELRKENDQLRRQSCFGASFLQMMMFLSVTLEQSFLLACKILQLSCGLLSFV